MKKYKYIVTKTPLFKRDNEGNFSVCREAKLAVFYFPRTGKRRYYRQLLDNPEKGMKLLTFNSEKSAQKACDVINAISGDGGYLVEEVEETFAFTAPAVWNNKVLRLIDNNIYMFKLHQKDEVYVGRRELELFSIEYEDKCRIYHKDEVEWSQHLPIIQGAFEM